MIEFFVTGDFKVIQSQVYIILAMWVIMILAVCVDLWAGTDSAKARGEKIYSGGLRRTFSKLGDYWRIQVMALIFDLIGSCIDWYTFDARDGGHRVDRGPKCLGKREGKEEPGGKTTGCNSSYYSMR